MKCLNFWKLAFPIFFFFFYKTFCEIKDFKVRILIFSDD